MSSEPEQSQLFQRGLSIRKAVLGDAHVNESMANVSEFARPMQELVTEFCWGVVWAMDGLPKRTKSLLNLVMLTALNRLTELGVHVRGALNNGVTEAENSLKEQFTEARAARAMDGANRAMGAAAVAESLEKAVLGFAGEARQSDDITILVLRIPEGS